jgi:hypothetical protein
MFGIAGAFLSGSSHSGALAQTGKSAVPVYGSVYRVVHAYGGITFADVLGDKDKRYNFSVGVEYFKPEPVFRFKRKRADLMQEFYYEQSWSVTNAGTGRNVYQAIGYLFGPRYNWHWGHAWGGYLDMGLGMQLNNHRTSDLPSRLNTTPFAGIGFWIPTHSQPLTVGLRYLHVSNAHQVGANAGQNQFSLDVGVRF